MGTLSQTLRVGLALFLAMFGTSALPTASAYAMGEATADEAVQTQLTDLAVTAAQEAAPPAEVLPPATESSPVPPVDTSTPPSDGVTDVTEPVAQGTQEVNPLPAALFSAPEAKQGDDKKDKDDKDKCDDNDRFAKDSRNDDCDDEEDCDDDRRIGGNDNTRGDQKDECDEEEECENSDRASPNNDRRCVYKDAKTGSLSIVVSGSINGSKLYVDGNEFKELKHNTTMPVVKTGLSAGVHTVTVKKGGKTLATTQVTIATCPKKVTPVKPSHKDACYLDRDGIYVDDTKGVIYKVNGVETTGWVEYEGVDLNVTPEPDEGYVLSGGSTVAWSFTFTNEQCLTITKSAQVASDTNLDGLIGVGDTVTWTITVTNTSDEKCESFYVKVEDPNAVLDDEGYVGVLMPGKSKELTAVSTITANDLEVCKVTNTATFYGWRAHKYDRELSFFNVEEEGEWTDPLATNSASDTYNLVCPEPGQVLGDTTVKPAPVVASTPQVLPATLPATGGQSESNLGIVLGIVLSALTYFAMMRRQQEA
jgi:LPXTG-motif cell wall-anchored protein